MTREPLGRVLCFALGMLYSAGIVPLFTFGEPGKQLWSIIEQSVKQVALAIDIAPWFATTIVGFFAIGGPLALVWLIAGPGVKRVYWILLGAIAYGLIWLFAVINA